MVNLCEFLYEGILSFVFVLTNVAHEFIEIFRLLIINLLSLVEFTSVASELLMIVTVFVQVNAWLPLKVVRRLLYQVFYINFVSVVTSKLNVLFGSILFLISDQLFKALNLFVVIASVCLILDQPSILLLPIHEGQIRSVLFDESGWKKFHFLLTHVNKFVLPIGSVFKHKFLNF